METPQNRNKDRLVEFSDGTVERFWSLVRIDTHAQTDVTRVCWEWMGETRKDGYGRFTGCGRHHAHRLAYALWNKTYPPDDLLILHSCDNRLCVNPYHLTLGTHDANMADMAKKGRHGNASLTREEVVRVLHSYYDDDEPAALLAEAFGVSTKTIENIVAGETYREIFREFFKSVR